MIKEKVSEKKAKQKRPYVWLRRFARLMLGILIFLLVVILFVRSPWGQDIIIQKGTKYVSNKTNTRVEVEKFFITFDGDLAIKGLFLDDKKGDTLVYAKSIEADIALWPLIKGEGIGIDAIDAAGLRAGIFRKDTIESYNFQFLIDAFIDPNAPIEVETTPSTAQTNIYIGQINIENAAIDFVDDVIGMDSKFVIGTLNLSMEYLDLDAMTFKADEGYVENSRIKIHQRPFPVDPNAEEGPLPFFSINEFNLNNVYIDYFSSGDGIAAILNIETLSTEIPKANLATNDFDISALTLKNSTFAITTSDPVNATTEKAEAAAEDIKKDSQNFEWPDIRFSLTDYSLEHITINYQVKDTKPKKGTFNPDAIFLSDIKINGSTLYLGDKSAGINLDNLTLNEASGFNLKELAVVVKVTDKNLLVDGLKSKINQNKLNGSVKLEYPSLATLIEKPEQSKVSLNISSFQADINDVFQFSPELKQNEYLRALSKKYLTGSLIADGYLSTMNIPKVNANWGSTTRITTNGTLFNATDPDHLAFDFKNLDAISTRTDLLKFVNEADVGVRLPDEVAVNGALSGSTSQIKTDLKINTSQGLATINGSFNSKEQLTFEAAIDIEEYRLDQLLQNEQLGPISITLDGKGSGRDMNSLTANLKAVITNFQLKDYTINDLVIDGDIKEGNGKISSNYKDENLNLDLDALVVLDSVAPEADLFLNIIGADLKGLGLMQRSVKTGLKLKANFKGNSIRYDVKGEVIDGVVVYDDKTYLLGSLKASAHVDTDTTSIYLKNQMIDIDLESNTDPTKLADALQQHVFSYFYRDAKLPDSIKNPVQLKLKGKISQAPLLKEVFFVNIQGLDTINVTMDFDEKARRLKADITAPYINYAGNEIDSLRFRMDTDRDNFNFDLGFKGIKAGPLAIERTEITANQINNELNLDFSSFHNEEKFIHVQTQITGNRDRLRLHVLPDEFLLNKKLWTIPSENEIIYTKDDLEFNSFRINKGNQSIDITDKYPEVESKHIAVSFENFMLSEIFDYLNPDEQFAKGTLNGNFTIKNPFAETGILADLTIDQLEVMDVNMGNLSIDAKSEGGANYDFNIAIEGGDVTLDVIGDYVASETDAILNLDLDISKFNMKALEGFSLGEISNTEGYFTGKFNINGPIAAPVYKGSLTFKQATFEVTKFNTAFTFPNENLNIDVKGLSMDGFTILDANGNNLKVTGGIGTENIINPTFDLSLKARDFQLMNATEEDNDFLYGQATIDADATIKGDLQIPFLSIKATVKPTTDITYVMPSAIANVEERDGVVLFVNRENPDAILTQTEEQTATLTGFDVTALISVKDDANVKIIIDEETGDNFEIYGEGDFDFSMNPNGRMNLTGVYKASGGHFEMNLYSLVNRRFDIVEGSSVTWSGDPFDAALDVKAKYDVETSASSLMAAEISGSDPSVKSKFRQVLPFYVYLSVDGELLAPEISFSMDMPEDEQGAIGGQVYSRLQQLNSQESELNKQVFSLLVLNRFYPESGSDGSSGGVASIARDNLNDALSDQLNLFSDKILGDTGIELDFGLDSYTDYQGDSPTERTQLDIAAKKKLFNDRLIVSVGSEVDIQGSSSTDETTPLIGNVSLEYILTENGRYRLKGFRRNEFENLIDGQTIASGIALIFQQEFNKFSELKNALFNRKTEEEKEKEAESKEKLDLQKQELKEEDSKTDKN